jgi:hypothetical protein
VLQGAQGYAANQPADATAETLSMSSRMTSGGTSSSPLPPSAPLPCTATPDALDTDSVKVTLGATLEGFKCWTSAQFQVARQ